MSLRSNSKISNFNAENEKKIKWETLSTGLQLIINEELVAKLWESVKPK
jgi:hypothetical protein